TTTTYTGSSNQFVVRPFALSIEDSISDTIVQAADADGDDFRKAGEDFAVNVRAVAWQAGDDSDDDGLSDSGADLTDNASTPNFGSGGTATVDLSHNLVLPATPGGLGTLSGGEDVGGFSNGVAEATLSFDEVGIIDLAAITEDYLGQAGVDVTGSLNNIGRFTPYRFGIAANTPTFANTCTAGATAFTYLDQNFYYDDAPVLTVTALNAAGDVTMNYGGTGAERFWKLGTSLDRSFTDQTVGAGGTHTLDTMTDDTVALGGDTDFDGMGSLVLENGEDGDVFLYERIAEEDEFDAEIDITFNAVGLTDTDGICYDPDDDGTCDDFTIGGTGGVLQRFGRLVIGNGFGSDLLPINVQFETQYFDGAGFVQNTDDSCTLIDDLDMNGVPDITLISAVETSVTGTVQVCPGSTSTMTLANNPLSAGEGGMSFSAPGCAGSIDITLDLPG
ncbi:MAG: DUF6701 domain-containing protein, partial [Gammaproteobacteria bacterium]